MNLAVGLATGGFSGSIIDMVMHAGPVAKLVLVVLLAFSIGSWAIIGYKWRMLRRVKAESDRFQELYHESNSLSSLHAAAKRMPDSPPARLFAAGYAEVSREVKAKGGSSPGVAVEQLEGHLKRTLERVARQEISQLERALSFLATTGSTTPFIGLFGTVWGVMDSFRSIGVKGSAHIASVAPGISEALIATAAGLVAAIPAVIAYNYFVHQVRALAAEIEGFVEEVSARLVSEME